MRQVLAGSGVFTTRVPLTANQVYPGLTSFLNLLCEFADLEDVVSDGFNGAGGQVLKLPMFYLEGMLLHTVSLGVL